MASCPTPHREALEQALRSLAERVTRLGLHVAVIGPVTLSVSGEAPGPDEADGGHALLEPPGPLSQSITIESLDGRLWWCWVWDDPAGDGHDSEPIRPIEEIDEVARRVRNVVSPSPAARGRSGGPAGATL